MKDVENNISRAKRVIAAKTKKFEYVEEFSFRRTGLYGYGNIHRLNSSCELFDEDETDEDQQFFYDYFRSAKE